MATNGKRPIELIKATWDPSRRRMPWPGIPELVLFFPPMTPAVWGKARGIAAAAGEDPNDSNALGLRLLVEMAELEDGSKAFAGGDITVLRRQTKMSDIKDVIDFMSDTGPVVLTDERVTEAQETVDADPT